jgi:Zn-dependent M28 family amino/carboxypeptidase
VEEALTAVPEGAGPGGAGAVQAERLEAHVRKLAGEIGERNIFRPHALHAAADYISEEWGRQGYEVAPMFYLSHGIPVANLEVTLAGGDRAQEILVVGAHYDTVQGSPGANDNASGVAALLEISRRLAGTRHRRTLRLVAFVNEEPPFFFWGDMGSRQYAKAARARGDDIRLMVSLETMGCFRDEPGSQRYPPFFRWFFPPRGDFIAFVSNFRSGRVLRRFAAAFRRASSFPSEYVSTFSWLPGVAWSDHLNFWREGYPALMVTDTAFYRYPYYHRPDDTPEKLDYPRLAQVTEGLAGALSDLAGAHEGVCQA